MRTDKPVDAGPTKAMENYREFLKLETKDPALRAEAMRRLGDLNLEAAEIERSERDQGGARVRSPPRRSRSTRCCSSPTRTTARAMPCSTSSRAPTRATARADEALSALDRLVARFPSSRLIDEAQFRRGEILFSAKRYADAEGAYADVIRRGTESTFYEQSLYKDGWALFKLGRNDESLNSFARLLDRKLVDPKTPTR